MFGRFGRFEWLPAGLTILAAAMFVAVVVAFAREVFSFRDAVEAWARRDLRSQAELAAEHLVEPLRTQDFRRIREFSDQLKAKGLELAITSVRGGRIFIAHGAEGLFGRGAGTPVIGESVERGEYVISVMTPLERVLEPYFRPSCSRSKTRAPLPFGSHLRQRLRSVKCTQTK